MTSLNLAQQLAQIIAAKGTSKREEYIRYCLLAVGQADAGSMKNEEAAYAICGASAYALDQLSDVEREVATLACSLELPAPHRDPALGDWQALVAKIRVLAESIRQPN